MMLYFKGTLLGLTLFSAWVVALGAIVLLAITFRYWCWALLPAAFIMFGIHWVKDQALATPEGDKH